MKKIIFTLVFLMGFIVKAQDSKPILSFDKEVIDYGKILEGSNGDRFFQFTNTGDSPLVFESAQGSCGCTVPTLPTKPIMPKKRGKIKVNYDTKRIGRFSKSVTIVTNASDKPKIIRIRGEVLTKENFEKLEK